MHSARAQVVIAACKESERDQVDCEAAAEWSEGGEAHLYGRGVQEHDHVEVVHHDVKQRRHGILGQIPEIGQLGKDSPPTHPCSTQFDRQENDGDAQLDSLDQER